MIFSEEILKKVVHFGILSYPVDKSLNILDLPSELEEQFITDFNNPKSEVAKNYKKGQDKAEYAIDIKLFEMAKEGDLKAIKEYELRKKNREKLSKNTDDFDDDY